MDIEKAITEGIVFKGGKSPSGKQEDKVKTKAKKKSYITGLHGSGAAKMKAEFRKKRYTPSGWKKPAILYILCPPGRK